MKQKAQALEGPQSVREEIVLQPSWRSPLRLLSMFGITLGMSGAYGLRALLGRMSPRFTSYYMQLWSRRILRWTGIQVSAQNDELAKGCILIANHRSYTDIPVIMSSALPFRFDYRTGCWPETFKARSTIVC